MIGPALAAEPWTIDGRVVGVSDGDTITILDLDKRQHKIRFNGIDAPEKKQPFGNRSRQILASLIFDRNVRAECHKRDRYGREICKILDDSRDIGLEQIRAGLAWWYRAYAKEQSPDDRERYEQAEQEARARRLAYGGNQIPCRRGSGESSRPVDSPRRAAINRRRKSRRRKVAREYVANVADRPGPVVG
ncbi:MAG: thermonuclease family protein [Burkholderiales bacterium]